MLWVHMEAALCVMIHVKCSQPPPLHCVFLWDLALVGNLTDLRQAANTLKPVLAQLTISAPKFLCQLQSEFKQTLGLGSFCRQLRVFAGFDFPQSQTLDGISGGASSLLVVALQSHFQVQEAPRSPFRLTATALC